jgi:hypothetical protein
MPPLACAPPREAAATLLRCACFPLHQREACNCCILLSSGAQGLIFPERSPIYPLELVLKFSLQPLSLTWFRFHPYTLKTDQNTSFSHFYRFDQFIITSSVLCAYHLQCEKPQLPRAPPPMPRMPSYMPLPRYLTYIGST